MNTKTIERYERCLRVNRKMSETSVKNYVSDIKAFSEFVNKDLFEVTEEDVNNYLDNKRKQGVGASRYNFSLSVLCNFYQYAKGTYMKYNPTKNVKRMRVKKKEEAIGLNKKQIKETREKLAELGDIQLEVYFSLLICSGVPKYLISEVKWANMYWTKKYFTVNTTNGNTCVFYLDDYTIEKLHELKKYRKDKGIKRGQVFIVKNKGLHSASLETQSYWLKKIRDLMGYERLTFNEMKKSHLNYLSQQRKFTEEEIKIINEHKSFPSELRQVIMDELDELKFYKRKK